MGLVSALLGNDVVASGVTNDTSGAISNEEETVSSVFTTTLRVANTLPSLPRIILTVPLTVVAAITVPDEFDATW